MFEQDIKTQREKMATALAAANGFAKEMKEQPERKGEIGQSFDRAYEEFKNAKLELQKLEGRADAMKDTATEFERVSAPATFARTGSERPVATEFAQVRQEAFATYLKGGKDALTTFLAGAAANAQLPREQFALLGTQDDLGGFLVPEDFRAEIVKDLAGFAVIRKAGARVITTTKNEVVFPSIKRNSGTYPKQYTSGFAGTWRKEGAQGTDGTAPARQNQPTFGEERIVVHLWQPDAVVLTEEFLDDAVISPEAILAELIAETKALDEDYSFINGTGVGQPLGLLDTTTGLSTINSGHATQVKYAAILDIYADLAAQYRGNASWLMNSATFADILKLENTGGFNLFPANQLPGTLLGKTVHFSEFMPDVAASAKPIIFGDFRYYVIAERTELRVKRLTERFAPNVGILVTARVGGRAIRTAPFRTMTISA